MFNVYLITNVVNGKKYVGITKKDIDDRFKDHVNTTRKNKKYALHHALLKYGVDSFTVQLLEQTNEPDREKFWIDYYQSYKEGYNLTKGGDGTVGFCLSDEQKANRSKQTKLLHKSKSVGMYGKTQTERQRSIVSSMMIGCKRKKDHYCEHCKQYFDKGNFNR